MHELALKKPSRLTQYFQNKSILNRKNLFWSWYDPYNFGDWIGPYLYRAITGTSPIYCTPHKSQPCTFFITAGSILRKIQHDDVAIVWGSGIISRGDIFAKPLKIHAVRGPHSMQRCHELGYDCPAIFGDPAILLPDYYTPKSTIQYRVGIIPHFVDLDIAISLFRNHSDTIIIDVTKPIENVIEQIASCETTLSSSLHGLIISHAYGRPCAWTRFSDRLEGDDIKFLDYLAAGGIRGNISPVAMRHGLQLNNLVSTSKNAPFPDNKALVPALSAACPFPKKAHHFLP